MTYVEDILRNLSQINKRRQDFLLHLFTLMLALPARMTFRNMSRYSPYCERSFARHFTRSFDWSGFNRALSLPMLGPEIILATDCTFVPKSGKHTYGLDHFFNGRTGRTERGLELSVLALIDAQTKQAYTLSAQQTPPRKQDQHADEAPSEQGRTAFYLSQVEHLAEDLPERVRYVVGDGYYAKKAYLDGVCALGLHVITKLRSDAHLRHLYRGPRRKGPGRPRQYAGKVDLQDVNALDYVGELEPGLHLYTAVVNSPHFKRNLRLAYLLDRRRESTGGKARGKVRYALLCSTETSLSAREVVRLYRLRFQIEFIFRDAKQYTGLTEAQTRSQARLHFHFNASLSALNVARRQSAESAGEASKQAGCPVFSMASIKRRGYNMLYLDRIISELDLEAERVLIHPAYERLCNYGAIAA